MLKDIAGLHPMNKFDHINAPLNLATALLNCQDEQCELSKRCDLLTTNQAAYQCIQVGISFSALEEEDFKG